jgi:folate-dependent phosphoribosylglycinamide formyltransferase PurN
MSGKDRDLEEMIRVVMFGSGPVLTHDAKQFLYRLDNHPEIAFLGAFCQSESQTFGAVVKDLWRRRRLLAIPLLFAWIANSIGRFMTQPRAEIELNRRLQGLSERVHFVKDIHAEDVLVQVRSLSPDLGLIYGSPILKSSLFEIPTFGTLGIHHGKVPEYRGNKTTFWAIYNGEERAGVTIQKVNAGLDTGQILKEGTVPIGHRSYRAVWHELEMLGLDLYIQTILDVKHGEAIFRPQLGPKAKLYRNPKFGDFLMYWWRQLNRRMGKS